MADRYRLVNGPTDRYRLRNGPTDRYRLINEVTYKKILMDKYEDRTIGRKNIDRFG